MKKITTLILAVLFSIIGYGQGDFPVSPNYGGSVTADFQKRVIDDAGTYYSNVAAHNIDERKSYGLNPIFEFYPAASKEGTLYSQKPTDGSGDFTVTRDAFSTTLNEDGYYQNMLPNYPLIDYSNGIPVTITQPQRIRLTTRPLSFGHSDWTKSGATIEGDPSTAVIVATTNGDFEAGTTSPPSNWTNAGNHVGTSVADGTAPEGNNVCEVVASGAGSSGGGQLFSNDNVITSGTPYKLQFWAKSILGNTSLVVHNSVAATTITGSWVEYTKYFVASNTRAGYLWLAGAGTVRVDDVRFSEIIDGYPSPMLAPDLGSELVTDPAMSETLAVSTTGINWTTGLKWTMGSGVSTYDNTGTSWLTCTGLTEMSSGKSYELSFDFLSADAKFNIVNQDNAEIGFGVKSNVTTNSYTYYITPSVSVTELRIYGYTWTDGFTIDNFTIQEILPTATTPMTESYKLVEDGSTGQHSLASQIITITNGVSVTHSIFAKKGERSWIRFYNIYMGGAYFDLENGVIGTSIATSNTIEEFANGWYRCSITYISSGTAAAVNVYLSEAGTGTTYTGDGISGVYLFFAQLEEGSYPTTPIWDGSESSTVTRVADDISLTDLQTNSLLGSTTGMIAFEVEGIIGAATDLWLFEDTGAGDELGLRFNADETWQWYDHHSTKLIGTASASSSTKIAITWSGTAAIISKDGASEVITLDAAFDAMTDVSLGASYELGKTSSIIMDKNYWSATDLNNLTK